MRIAMIGTGYVGLVSGTCLADFGHHVTCVDKDQAKIEGLLAGRMPIWEPGLDSLVKSNVERGRLAFTTNLGEAVKDAEAVFIAVGTPSRRGDGHADLLVAGNFYGVPPIQGRYDASYGLLLHGLGDGRFAPVDMARSGVSIDGQARRMARVRTAGGTLVAVARNDDALVMLRPTGTRQAAPLVRVDRLTGGREGGGTRRVLDRPVAGGPTETPEHRADRPRVLPGHGLELLPGHRHAR